MKPLQFAFEAAPRPGESRRLRAGIDWVCMPLPFALNHVNCWLLGESQQRVLIDTGVANETTRAHWQQLFCTQKIPGQLLVTHFHPDHMGLAGWFAAQGSALVGSEVEVSLARTIWHKDDSAYASLYADWYRHNGLPDAVIKQVQQAGNSYRQLVHEPPTAWDFLAQGGEIEIAGRLYQVLEGRGHAPAMLMLYCASEGLLIAADQVLPTISPNVSLMPVTPDDNPLGSFLTTLESLTELPEDTLILPSHGLPFTGLHRRLHDLQLHHEQRCADILTACRKPQTAAYLFAVLFRRTLDAQQMSFALGESLAHLRYLEQLGQMHCTQVGDIQRFIAD